MKCIDCSNCVIETDDNRNAKARCKLKAPPKKGKIITWAMTVYASMIDAMIHNVGEYGDDRVRADLNKKKAAPAWCPNKLIRKEDDDNGIQTV